MEKGQKYLSAGNQLQKAIDLLTGRWINAMKMRMIISQMQLT